MNYTRLVKAIDAASQQWQARAVTAVNQALVLRNWLIGAYIVEFEQRGQDRANYGDRLLQRLASDLKARGLTGLGHSVLERVRRFYQVYPQLAAKIPPPLVTELELSPVPKQLRNSVTSGYEIGQPVVERATIVRPLEPELLLRLSWTHILELIRVDDPLQRALYENECLRGNWSKRQLQRQIGSLLYERTALSKHKDAVRRRAHRQGVPETIADLIRDPYVLEFTGLAERPEYTENALENALLDHLQQFLLELGAGFLFEARQRRITVGNEHEYIDLVFYHRHLRCHVLLDLKIRPFRHGDAGQMNFYLNWWRARVTAPTEQPPVGIILCSDKDQTKVEFATAGISSRLFVSRYLVALPSAEQLRAFLEADRARTELLLPPRRTPSRRRQP